MGATDTPGNPKGNEPASQEEKPKQVPNSQGPATPDTSEQTKTIQHPARK
jgi:hypothetical protein